MCIGQVEAHGDPASLSSYEKMNITATEIKWGVYFTMQTVMGTVKHSIFMLKDSEEIVFDSRDLSLRRVTIEADSIGYKMVPPPDDKPWLGSQIHIRLPEKCQKAGSKFDITFSYSTSPEAQALQWMTKEQTTDRKEPFLFSQSQFINARSLLPCFDTPSSKFTFSAEVSVPKGLTCLMSGISASKAIDDGDRTTFSFEQHVPIPSYLLAIVVGLLEKREISPRCAIWAEPSMLERAHYEVGETEQLIQTAEKIVGPYTWGRYDMVMLPSSFPYGGMENPCLTFLAPSLIAGDRSLVALVAHELAHSWSGNLVSNKSWEHFWLNEGITTFVERKIYGRLHGEKYRHFLAYNTWSNDLWPAVNEQFHPTSPLTKLVQDHRGVDPDDAQSIIPYEKGSTLLFTLEQLLGGSEVFEAYLRSYFTTFAQKSIDTNMWKAHLFKYFSDKEDVISAFPFDDWLHEVGMPPEKPKYDESLAIACKALREEWLNATEESVSDITATAFDDMKPMQKIEFLSQLYQEKSPIDHYKLAAIDNLYKLSKSGNSEILLVWIRLSIKARWEAIEEVAFTFINIHGRMKYCRPVYRDLAAWNLTAVRARDNFKANRPFMHPITAGMVEKEIAKSDGVLSV